MSVHPVREVPVLDKPRRSEQLASVVLLKVSRRAGQNPVENAAEGLTPYFDSSVIETNADSRASRERSSTGIAESDREHRPCGSLSPLRVSRDPCRRSAPRLVSAAEDSACISSS